MKKTATILLGSLCALCAQAADNIIGGSDYNHRTPIQGEDVILNPITDSTAEAFFGSNNPTYTIRSLSTTGTTSKWNCAFGLIIDINSTAETFDAFYNNGVMQWNDPYGKNLVFKNSAGNSTYATIDWGTFSMMVNTSSQSNKLQILTNANITGKSFTTNIGNIQMLIDNNSTVNYQMSDTTTFNNNSSLKIASGSTFNATNSSFAFNSNSSAIINGVFNYVATNSVNLKLRNAEISGAGAKLTSDVKSGTANTNAQIYLEGENTVSNGGSIEAVGALRLQSGSRLVIDEDAGGVHLTKALVGTTNYWGRILFAGNGELVLNKKNAITTDNTNGLAQLTNIGGFANPNKLSVFEDNNFEGIYFQETARMEITVSGAKANFNYIGRNANNDNKDGATPVVAQVHFEDFAEDTIYFNENSWWNDDKLVITANDGTNDYTKDQLELVEVNSEYGKYTLRFQIPEPSTYAAIFGAMALALAVYRRRK